MRDNNFSPKERKLLATDLLPGDNPRLAIMGVIGLEREIIIVAADFSPYD